MQALAQPTSSSTLAAALNCGALPSSLPRQPQLVAVSGSGGVSVAGMSGRRARAAGQRSSSGVTRRRGSSRPLSQLAGSGRRSGRTASRQACGLTLLPTCRARVRVPALAAHAQLRRLQLVSEMPSGRGARRRQRLQQAAGSGSVRGSSVQPTSQLSGAAGSDLLAAAVTARRQLLHRAAGASGLPVASGARLGRRRHVRGARSVRSGTIALPAASGKSATQVGWLEEGRGVGRPCVRLSRLGRQLYVQP